MRKLLKFWPIYLLITAYVVSWYNVDYFLIPTLLRLGWGKLLVGFITATWGLTDMLVAYIGWSRFRDLMKGVFAEDFNFMKKVLGETQAQGFLEKAKVHFARRYLQVNAENATIPKHKIFRIIPKILESGSYPLIFLIGILPIPGIRMGADCICGSMRWKKRFVVLALGSSIKTFCMVYGWYRIMN